MPLQEHNLPLELPVVEKYRHSRWEPPFGKRQNVGLERAQTEELVSVDRIDHKTIFPLELNTMLTGWAGSSWYFNRYMDPQNEQQWVGYKGIGLLERCGFHIGGSEHATGHLLYSRFWQKVLFDLGYVH